MNTHDWYILETNLSELIINYVTLARAASNGSFCCPSRTSYIRCCLAKICHVILLFHWSKIAKQNDRRNLAKTAICLQTRGEQAFGYPGCNGGARLWKTKWKSGPQGSFGVSFVDSTPLELGIFRACSAPRLALSISSILRGCKSCSQAEFLAVKAEPIDVQLQAAFTWFPCLNRHFIMCYVKTHH